MKPLAGRHLKKALEEAYNYGYRDGADAEMQEDVRGKLLPRRHQRKSRDAAIRDVLARANHETE